MLYNNNNNKRKKKTSLWVCISSALALFTIFHKINDFLRATIKSKKSDVIKMTKVLLNIVLRLMVVHHVNRYGEFGE